MSAIEDNMLNRFKTFVEEKEKYKIPKNEKMATVKTVDGQELSIDSEGNKCIELNNDRFNVLELKDGIKELYILDEACEKYGIFKINCFTQPLEYVYLPEGITHINAFKTSLKEIVLPFSSIQVNVHNEMNIKNLQEVLEHNPDLNLKMENPSSDARDENIVHEITRLRNMINPRSSI